jgi:hypothetical protein
MQRKECAMDGSACDAADASACADRDGHFGVEALGIVGGYPGATP